MPESNKVQGKQNTCASSRKIAWGKKKRRANNTPPQTKERQKIDHNRQARRIAAAVATALLKIPSVRLNSALRGRKW
jgi:hypothetical protein